MKIMRTWKHSIDGMYPSTWYEIKIKSESYYANVYPDDNIDIFKFYIGGKSLIITDENIVLPVKKLLDKYIKLEKLTR